MKSSLNSKANEWLKWTETVLLCGGGVGCCFTEKFLAGGWFSRSSYTYLWSGKKRENPERLIDLQGPRCSRKAFANRLAPTVRFIVPGSDLPVLSRSGPAPMVFSFPRASLSPGSFWNQKQVLKVHSMPFLEVFIRIKSRGSTWSHQPKADDRLESAF